MKEAIKEGGKRSIRKITEATGIDLGASEHWVRRSTSEIAAALTGDYRREHLFVLQQELALWEFYQAQIAVCSPQIEQYLNELTAKVDLDVSPLPKPKRGQRNSGNASMFDLRTHLYRLGGVDFTSIDGECFLENCSLQIL